MGYYEGKQPCAGCGRPGTDRARIAKDHLCPECQELLNKARTVELEPREYARVFVTWYSFYHDPLNKMMHEFLMKLSNPAAEHLRFLKQKRLGNIDAITASDVYYIPAFVADALEDLIRGIQREGSELKRQEAAAREAAREETAKCRQQYFEEGVRYGRQLLAQLNRGEISLSDFEAIPKKYSK